MNRKVSNNDSANIQLECEEILSLDNSIRFVGSENVFWSKAFGSLTNESYEDVSRILKESELKTTVPKAFSDIINLFELKTDVSKIKDWNKIQSKVL